ncbi:MAG: hypothetical protein ABI758_05305 [Candidatus Woesebacteria bacterium]
MVIEQKPLEKLENTDLSELTTGQKLTIVWIFATEILRTIPEGNFTKMYNEKFSEFPEETITRLNKRLGKAFLKFPHRD